MGKANHEKRGVAQRTSGLNEARWLGVLESARDAIVSIDERGQVTLFNPAAERMFGYRADEIIGRNVSVLMPSPSHEEHDRYLQEYRRGGERKAMGLIRPVEARRKNGERFPAELALSEARVVDGVAYTGIIRDVSEQKRAEEALQRERDFARRLLDTAQVIVLVLDLDGRIVQFNRYMEEISGYSLDEVKGADWFATFLPDEERPTLRARFSQTIGRMKVQGNASSLLTKDGRVRTIEWHAKTLDDADGCVQGVLAIGQDVTERHGAEEEIRRSAREQAAVAELGLRALSTTDMPALMNEAVTLLADILGVEFSWVLELLPGGKEMRFVAGVGWQDGLARSARVPTHSDSQAAFTLASDTAIIVEDLRTESRFQTLGPLHEAGVISGMSAVIRGTSRPFGMVSAYTARRRHFAADEVNFLQSVANVLAEAIMRRRSERRLATQYAVTHVLAGAGSIEEAFAPLLQSVCEGVRCKLGEFWRVDSEHNVMRWVGMWHVPSLDLSEFEAASGKTVFAPGESLPGGVWETGRPAWMTDVASDEDFLRRSCAARADLHGGFAFPIVTGNQVHGALAFYRRDPSFPDDDLLQLLEALGRQIGEFVERKRVEGTLKQAQMVAQQRQRLADVGAITAKVVHDLGNPLAGLSMQSQLILRRVRRGEVAQIEEPLERMLATVHRVDSLIREFKEFARDQRLHLKNIEVSEFVEGLANVWRPVAAARGVHVDLHMPAVVPALRADPEKLHRVFDNLLKNSLDAIESRPGHITVRVAVLEAGKVRISVEDTGSGILEGVDVFRLFETTKPDGTGLGLPVANQVVLAHGGALTYAPLTPHGTVFHVDLPCDGPSVP